MKRTGHEIAHASKKTQRGKENSKETSACLSKETKNAFFSLLHFPFFDNRYALFTNDGRNNFVFFFRILAAKPITITWLLCNNSAGLIVKGIIRVKTISDSRKTAKAKHSPRKSAVLLTLFFLHRDCDHDYSCKPIKVSSCSYTLF